MSLSRRQMLLGAGGTLLWPLLAARGTSLIGSSAAGAWHATASSGAILSAHKLMLERSADWLTRASTLVPVLDETPQAPLALVEAVPDHSSALRYRMRTIAPGAALEQQLFGKGDVFILDFGGHRAGYFSCDIEGEGKDVDAPVRLRLTFGEVPTDVAEPLYPYRGVLATAWLPDEVVNVDDLPRVLRFARRHAFRYVKVEVIDASRTFKVRFRRASAIAVHSAGVTPPPLNSGDTLLDRIDAVSMATLRDCMQTVFEDGPRRDRRLWLGDLRLQALSAYATYGGHALVKRCLYLFAALPRVSDGLMAACIYEKPRPAYGKSHVLDYAALFNVALADYVEATPDLATGHDLWPAAWRQVELLRALVNEDGLFVDPKSYWLFIDWNRALDRTAAMQGVLIYAFRRTMEVAARLGLTEHAAELEGLVARMRLAARAAYYDQASGVFVSGPKRQISWASQAWLSLAGVPASSAEGASALKRVMAMPEAVRPVTPYLYHYVVEGMLACGLRTDALDLIRQYWGGMIAAGADTFWEIYDPAQPLSSPYGDIHVNSYCHAWSCTPSYFLRSRGLALG